MCLTVFCGECRLMASEWFYQVMGDEVGPISIAELRDLAKRGVISSDTLVKEAPDGGWILAERMQGLFPEPNVSSRPTTVAVSAPVKARLVNSAVVPSRGSAGFLIAMVVIEPFILCLAAIALGFDRSAPETLLSFGALWFFMRVVMYLIGCAIGLTKGRVVDGALLGALLGPLGWCIAGLLADLRIKCPACKGVVDHEACKCRHCGSSLRQTT